MKKTAIIITVLAVSVSLLIGVAFGAHKEDFQKAVKHYKAGRYEEAVSTLEEYVKEWPEGRAYYLMGYANYALGKQEEAAKNFHDAYLVDPEMSPQEFRKSIGIDTGIMQKPKVKKMPAAEAQPAPPAAAPPAAKPEAAKAPAPAAPAPPEAAKAAPAPPPPAKAAPAPRPRPRPTAEPEPSVPFGPEMLVGLGLLPLVFGLVFYLFLAFCLFRIGKKTDTKASWLAFVPFINSFWPFVGASGKSKLWILLMIIFPPIAIYMWMLIATRFGKSKALGLLVLVPVVNLVFLILLAFKWQAGAPSASMGLDLPEIPDEFPELPEVPGMEGADEEYEAAGAAEEPSAGAEEEEDFFGEGFGEEEPAEEAPQAEEPAEDDFGELLDEAEEEPEILAEEEPAEEAEDIFELGEEEETEEDFGAFEIGEDEGSADQAPSLEEMGFGEEAEEAAVEEVFEFDESDEATPEEAFEEEEEKPGDFQ